MQHIYEQLEIYTCNFEHAPDKLIFSKLIVKGSGFYGNECIIQDSLSACAGYHVGALENLSKKNVYSILQKEFRSSGGRLCEANCFYVDSGKWIALPIPK